ncbi:MAG TPA: cyclic nucleotide-binding domain-containing protein [Anaerolineales bacterium]|nr:cyclic nucleotide-binding domain-containing protein [Anaerolineales bacterium]
MGDLETILQQGELFDGLSAEELQSIAAICREKRLRAGETITRQGEEGDELFIVCEGAVEVSLTVPGPDSSARAVVHLGRGQIFGEMALVDQGPRSATVRSTADNTLLQAMGRQEFMDLCERNHHLGYVVMRNMAADLSFKLRHRNLTGR